MVTYSTYTDQELCALLKAGDALAFKCIYDTYWKKLLFVAGKKLNDIAEAEELVQDIFMNLWKRREAFELKMGFEQYLSVAVKFEVYKHRARRVKQEQLAEELEAGFTGFEYHDWNLHDLEVLREELSKTIESLPPKCRLVFKMSRAGDKTNKQIAAEMGISEKAVEKHVTTAMKLLKSRFGNYTVFILLFKDLF